jgi:hypothetical protein
MQSLPELHSRKLHNMPLRAADAKSLPKLNYLSESFRLNYVPRSYDEHTLHRDYVTPLLLVRVLSKFYKVLCSQYFARKTLFPNILRGSQYIPGQ